MTFLHPLSSDFVCHRVRVAILCIAALCVTAPSIACGQTTPAKPQPTAAPVAGTPAPNTEADVIRHLNLVLRWYRQWTSLDVYLSRPGDEIYVQSAQSIAQQIVKLDFQSALAQAVLIGKAGTTASAGGNSQAAVDTHNVLRLQQRIDQQTQDLKAQLAAVNSQIATARSKQRSALLDRRDTLQGQLELAQALQENLQKLTSFMTSSENTNGSTSEMTGKILALQRTIPALTAGAPGTAKTTEKSAVRAPQISLMSSAQNEGLIGQMGQMVHLMSSLRVLSQLQDDATALQTSTQQLRAPLLAALRSTLQKGQLELSNAEDGSGNSAGTATASGTVSTPASSRGGNTTKTSPAAPLISQGLPESPAAKQREMADLVRHFKQLSAATLPLSQELILIEQSQANLDQLRTSIKHDYGTILRSLLLRVAMILIALGLIWLFSWLWRRATFRYVHDVRRRRQFLVLRRAITGFCMFVVVVLGFVSDFSSLATYAGLITAGIAVALQAVILSIAAYFFLVGRYGVRVGDRVTVVYNGANAVAGDVVDIGLVRFYMMELAGTGIDMQPTGRICVFPNSVLFQTNPLFKQMPGTEYTWREIGLPLAPDADVELAQKELLAAVDIVYATYREVLERRRLNAEETLAIHSETPKPQTRVRFTSSGLEVVVRYPIPLRQAAELDDRMVREVVEILRKNPAIRVMNGAVPTLRS